MPTWALNAVNRRCKTRQGDRGARFRIEYCGGWKREREPLEITARAAIEGALVCTGAKARTVSAIVNHLESISVDIILVANGAERRSDGKGLVFSLVNMDSIVQYCTP
jgi:hypothetical protein